MTQEKPRAGINTREAMRHGFATLLVAQPIILAVSHSWKLQDPWDLFPMMIIVLLFIIFCGLTIATFYARWTEYGEVARANMVDVWIVMGIINIIVIFFALGLPKFTIGTSQIALTIGFAVLNIALLNTFEGRLRDVQFKKHYRTPRLTP